MFLRQAYRPGGVKGTLKHEQNKGRRLVMVGPFVNGAAVIFGSVSGALLGERVSENLRKKMPMIFGCASMGLGIAMVVKVK